MPTRRRAPQTAVSGHALQMTEISIRASRVGDGAACAALWQEMGSLFTEMNPHTFQVPSSEGLAEWFEEINANCRGDEARLLLIAEVDGVVAGALSAALHEPIPGAAQRELQTDLARPRLHVNSLSVSGAYRRDGVGTALMQAVEQWGRSRGAEVIILETEMNNPMSMPFYEQRMGFSAEVVIFRKEIAAPAA